MEWETLNVQVQKHVGIKLRNQPFCAVRTSAGSGITHSIRRSAFVAQGKAVSCAQIPKNNVAAWASVYLLPQKVEQEITVTNCIVVHVSVHEAFDRRLVRVPRARDVERPAVGLRSRHHWSFECDDVIRRAHVSRKREQEATAPRARVLVGCITPTP